MIVHAQRERLLRQLFRRYYSPLLLCETAILEVPRPLLRHLLLLRTLYHD